MTSSSEKDKNISNPFMGNTTAQIHLFLAMRHNKPIGVYRHFNMFGIFKEFCDSFRPKEGDFTPKHIWTFLDTMYDMDGLHSTETKPRYLECVRDYTLPTEDSFYRRRMDEIVKELRQTPADDEKKEECSPKRAAKEPWKNAFSENATQGTVGIRPMSSRTGASSSAQTQNPSTPKREYSIRISTSADTPGAGSSQSSRRHSTRGTSAKGSTHAAAGARPRGYTQGYGNGTIRFRKKVSWVDPRGPSVREESAPIGKQGKFAGHEISSSGVKPEQAKITAIAKFREPKTNTSLICDPSMLMQINLVNLFLILHGLTDPRSSCGLLGEVLVAPEDTNQDGEIYHEAAVLKGSARGKEANASIVLHLCVHTFDIVNHARDPGEPSPSADRERRDSSSSSEIGGASTARSTPVRTTPGGIRVRKESDKDSDSSSAPTSTRSNSKRTRSQLSQGGGGVSSPKDNLSPATKRLRRHL
ncbi:unnamed protein product [Cyprideis torosa]|uniref:Uncharacterized protein n=1 Tax=Cyprideis torosa TaxID=163714 RepID=A0A7R8WIX0_9CRUS|nr:unnamed protein product [Cyprideis torosa]CAG0894590.1 unnamed protein product [Cyprideis torosa]